LYTDQSGSEVGTQNAYCGAVKCKQSNVMMTFTDLLFIFDVYIFYAKWLMLY